MVLGGGLTWVRVAHRPVGMLSGTQQNGDTDSSCRDGPWASTNLRPMHRGRYIPKKNAHSESVFNNLISVCPSSKGDWLEQSAQFFTIICIFCAPHFCAALWRNRMPHLAPSAEISLGREECGQGTWQIRGLQTTDIQRMRVLLQIPVQSARGRRPAALGIILRRTAQCTRITPVRLNRPPGSVLASAHGLAAAVRRLPCERHLRSGRRRSGALRRVRPSGGGVCGGGLGGGRRCRGHSESGCCHVGARHWGHVMRGGVLQNGVFCRGTVAGVIMQHETENQRAQVALKVLQTATNSAAGIRGRAIQRSTTRHNAAQRSTTQHVTAGHSATQRNTT